MPRIAYLGPAGTFTDMALTRLLESRGPAAPAGVAVLSGPADAVPAESNADALRALARGDVDYACVPLENSVEGAVTQTYDLLAAGPRLQILAETELDIAFSILVRPGTATADIRTLRSHPVGLAQVRLWAEQNLPGVRLEQAASNSAAARDVAEGRADAAAAPAAAGPLYGLDSLADEVADVDGARTRFVLVGRPCPPLPRTGEDRTAVVLDLPNVAGSLLQAMTEFGVRGIDLTRIESRPTKTGLGTYRFHIDCSGHIDDPLVAEALRALHRRCERVRFLGSWPKARPSGSPPPSVGDSEEWLAALRSGEGG